MGKLLHILIFSVGRCSLSLCTFEGDFMRRSEMVSPEGPASGRAYRNNSKLGSPWHVGASKATEGHMLAFLTLHPRQGLAASLPTDSPCSAWLVAILDSD